MPGSAARSPRALVFELDNVLYDGTFWHRWLWQLLTRMGVQRDFHGFCSIWQRGYLHDVYRGAREFVDALRAFLSDSGLTAGQINEVEAASAARRRELYETVRPLPGVVKTLSQLSTAGVALGVLANSEWSADDLRLRIERLGLVGRFRFVFSSRDLGHVKPEPGSYQAALDSLRLPATEVALVGCTHDDLAGAAAAGLRTIAVHADADVPAHYCLRRFDDLLSVCIPGAVEAAAT